MRPALLAMLLVACGRGAEQDKSDSAVAGQPDSLKAVVGATTIQPPSAATTKPLCPPTGLWAECSVFERLDRAGLAPRRDSSGATEPPLTAKGYLLRVGNSELELYIYADASARERDEVRLDRAKYLEYSVPVPMRPLPTLIRSANLIAVLNSRNEHLRERVADAITAGPPQPSRP